MAVLAIRLLFQISTKRMEVFAEEWSSLLYGLFLGGAEKARRRDVKIENCIIGTCWFGVVLKIFLLIVDS